MKRTCTTPLSCALLVVLVSAGCDAVHRAQGDTSSVRVVEAAVFEGGYGIGWHQKIAAQYNREHQADGVRVDLWGDPRVDEKIRPRILRGDPPDLILVGSLPIWLLISTGKLYPFDSALDGPAPGSDVPWRELFIPGTLSAYTSEGSVYAIPSAFGAWACWYDARLFRENGWRVPKTWKEFDALCNQIKERGVAPLAFQGKYPSYAWYTLVSLMHRCGGLAAINRLNAMEPGAFSHPDVVRAAGLLQDMALNHFQKGAMAMNHTESQLQFCNNKAAMVFCGVWLENEQKDTIPPGFELRCFNVPAVEGGKGNPELFNGSGAEFLFVPAEARNPELALDFARYMVSPKNAPDMATSIGVISPLRGGTPREAVTPALESVLDMIDNAGGIFTCRLTLLLQEWTNQVMYPALLGLLLGEITPEEFCATLDQGVAEAKANPDILIPPFVPYDPVRFGESP